MRRDNVWSLLFSGAIAVLMLAILLTRSEPAPLWVLVLYPAIGAALGQVASRTSPTVEGIAWIETGTIAAACIVVLAILVNVLLVDRLTDTVHAAGAPSTGVLSSLDGLSLPAIAVLLWWALERRLTRMRRAGKAPGGRADRAGGQDSEPVRARRIVPLALHRPAADQSAPKTDRAA